MNKKKAPQVARELSIMIVYFFIITHPTFGETRSNNSEMKATQATMITRKFADSLSSMLKYHIKFSYTMETPDAGLQAQLAKVNPTLIKSISTISDGKLTSISDRAEIEAIESRYKQRLENAAKSARYSYDLESDAPCFNLSETLNIVDNRSQKKDFETSYFYNGKKLLTSVHPIEKMASIDVPLAAFPTVVKWSDFISCAASMTLEQLINARNITLDKRNNSYIITARDSYADSISGKEVLGEAVLTFDEATLRPLSYESYRTKDASKKLYYKKLWEYEPGTESSRYINYSLPTKVTEEIFENGAAFPTQVNSLKIDMFKLLDESKTLEPYIIPDGYTVYDQITGEQFTMGKKEK